MSDVSVKIRNKYKKIDQQITVKKTNKQTNSFEFFTIK